MSAHFEVFPSEDGHRWRLRAANGEIVAQSEGYEGGALAAEEGAMAAARAAREATTVHPTGGTGENPAMLSIDARQVPEQT